ncbi:phosphotransferase family protein [Aspergillus ruber CBS 135680]|uniref:Aminoglycoside phosphotransferase domain-containing protein n=1 Tax=Aspergillus ruber (strain CBS 135680) TaxID=1388766 RepID=A0A017SHJ0_ASPRC|nr:uncharacterized protein EURHEDRAFT_411236 [Aspergillus ruber CBS 135680]EYE96084.1 hypothetical protein EURHEDRAFT_411236 [Aspergillus ruber CBS 135680]
MDFDHLAEQESQRIFKKWIQHLVKNSSETLVTKLALQHRPGIPVSTTRFSHGAFNFCYQVAYEDGCRILVRFTALGRAVFRHEKVQDEVAVMRYLAENTSIPIPTILGSGRCAVGPYVVMTLLEGNLLSRYLRDPMKKIETLNLHISECALKKAYRDMADIVLELSKPEFSFIGALTQDKSGDWSVHKRPLTFNMNRIAQFSNIPPSAFAEDRFSNAADYFEELAKQHLYHLEYQRNDAVMNEQDCRKKYVARCLFRRLSRKVSKEHRHGPFRLFCDDFRPDNILVDQSKLEIIGAFDWEWSYAAPAEFTHAAPWWLLLERPEDWEMNLDHFLERYMPRLSIFLEALRECESRKMCEGSLLEEQCLSDAMEDSMENGLFWFCLAARHGAMFDEIYWAFLDQRYFGPFTTLEDRARLLSDEERMNLDGFVQRKLRQSSEGTLDTHLSIDEIAEL